MKFHWLRLLSFFFLSLSFSSTYSSYADDHEDILAKIPYEVYYTTLAPLLGPQALIQLGRTTPQNAFLIQEESFYKKNFLDYFEKRKAKKKAVLRRLVQLRNKKMIRCYLNHAPLDFDDFRSGLHEAASRRDTEIARIILDQGKRFLDLIPDQNPEQSDINLNNVLFSQTNSPTKDAEFAEIYQTLLSKGWITSHTRVPVNNFNLMIIFAGTPHFYNIIANGGFVDLPTFQSAIEHDDDKSLEYLLTHRLSVLDTVQNYEQKLLELAIEKQAHRSFEVLITQLGKGQLNEIQRINPLTLLEKAVVSKNFKAGEAILTTWPKIDVKDPKVLRTLPQTDLTLLKLFFKKGIQPESGAEFPCYNYLHQAAHYGVLENVRYLVEDLNMNVNMLTKPWHCMTPVSVAASEFKTDVIIYLISRNADLEELRKRAGERICSAIRIGRHDFAEIILEYSDKIGFNPSDIICDERSQNVKYATRVVESLYNYAKTYRAFGVVLRYLKSLPESDLKRLQIQDLFDDLILEEQSAKDLKEEGKNYIELITFLLNHGAKMNREAQHYITLLLNISPKTQFLEGNEEEAKNLVIRDFFEAALKNGRLVHDIDEDSIPITTPLGIVSKFNLPEAARYLISKAVPLNKTVITQHVLNLGPIDLTALEIAILNENWSIVDLLLQSGAELHYYYHNSISMGTFTGLSRVLLAKSARAGRLDIVHNILNFKQIKIDDLLLPEYPLPVLGSQLEGFGRTALSFAAEGGHVELIRYLLENGADPWKPGHYPENTLNRLSKPITWAKKTGNSKAVSLLWDAMMKNYDKKPNLTQGHGPKEPSQ